MEELKTRYDVTQILHIGSSAHKTFYDDQDIDIFMKTKDGTKKKMMEGHFLIRMNYPDNYLDFNNMLNDEENLKKYEEYRQMLKDMFEYHKEIYRIGKKYYIEQHIKK